MEKVSKLNGLNINVIGSSLIISMAIKMKIKEIFFFIIGQCTIEKVLNLLNPIRYDDSSIE